MSGLLGWSVAMAEKIHPKVHWAQEHMQQTVSNGVGLPCHVLNVRCEVGDGHQLALLAVHGSVTLDMANVRGL